MELFSNGNNPVNRFFKILKTSESLLLSSNLVYPGAKIYHVSNTYTAKI